MNKIKIALVDDSKQMKNLANQFLQSEDYTVVAQICDGNLASQKIMEANPDVVVLDLILPNKDGFEILDELKQNGVNAKIVVCSALSNSNFVQKALEMGAEHFVQKPCDFVGLDKSIKQVLDNVQPIFRHKNFSKNMDEKISNIFITVGIPAHIKGYQFLREAIKLTIASPEIIGSITKKLYPNIAKRFATSPSKVERAIRHAIEVAWNRGKIENINEVFGLPVYDANDKPTNGEFIALVADKMLVESGA